MRFVPALCGFLLIGSVAAVSGSVGSECVDDELLECFSSSPSAASAFCSKTVSWEGAITETVTPTVISTETVTITDDASIAGTTLPSRRKKRGTCTKGNPPFKCLRSLTRAASIDGAGITSACSCIGVLETAVSTVTAEPATVTITETSFTGRDLGPTGESSSWPSNAIGSTPSSSLCQGSTVVSTVTETLPPSVVVSTITASYISEYWSVVPSIATVTATEECSAVHITVTKTETTTTAETLWETITATQTVDSASVATSFFAETVTATGSCSAVTETETSFSIAPSFFTETETETITATESCSIVTETSISIAPSYLTETATEIETVVSVERSTTATTITLTTPTTTTVYSATLSTTTTQISTLLVPTTTTRTMTSTTTIMHTTVPDSGITNGAFELGNLSGWSQILQGAFASATISTPGTGAWGVGTAAYLSAGSGSSTTLWQFLSCTTGRKYKLTFDAKRGPTSAAGWTVRVKLGVPAITLESGFSDAVWTAYTHIYTCGGDDNARMLQLTAVANSGQSCAAWFDNFSLVLLSA